jgi:hypothetical protein
MRQLCVSQLAVGPHFALTIGTFSGDCAHRHADNDLGMPVEALARELVAFDPRISEEVAEHLIARAVRLEAHAGTGTASDRADRFRTLAELIQRELGLGERPLETDSKVSKLPSLVI